MRAQLNMDSGSRFVKFIVLGGIALAFASGVAYMMRPGEPMQVAAQSDTELSAPQAPAAAPANPQE